MEKVHGSKEKAVFTGPTRSLGLHRPLTPKRSARLSPVHRGLGHCAGQRGDPKSSSARPDRPHASYDELASFAALERPGHLVSPAFRNDAASRCTEPVHSLRKVIFLASFEVDPRWICVWSATTRLRALRRWKSCQPHNPPSPVTIAAQASDIIECNPNRSVGVAWFHGQVHFGDGVAAIASNDELMVLGDQGCG